MPLTFDDLIPQQGGLSFDDLVPKFTAAETARDILKSTAEGPPKAAIGLLGAPGAIANLFPESWRDAPENRLPTGPQIERKAIEGGYMRGPTYEPQTPLGGYGQSISELATTAGLGPGGAMSKLALGAVVPGVAGEAVKQAGGGPAAELAASFLAPAAAGKLANVAQRSLATVPPTIEKTLATKTAQYAAVEQEAASIHVPKNETQHLVDDITKTLDTVPSLRPDKLDDIYAVLNKTEKANPDLGTMFNLRQNLRELTGQDAVAAKLAIPKVEAELERRSPGIMADIRTAEMNNRIAERARSLDKAFVKKELQTAKANSGLNLGNNLRDAAAAAATSAREGKYLKPEEIAALAQVARGTGLQNLTRGVSNILGGGGGLGALAAGAAGTYATGQPEWLGALGFPLAGFALRKGYNRSVARGAEGVKQRMLASSPLGQSMGAQYIPPQGILGALGQGVVPAAQRGLLNLQGF